MTVPASPAFEPHDEPHDAHLASRLNWLRAGVLGANDGIVSTAGLVVGVAGATANVAAILIAGLAGLVAGALSMAGGEYTSVSAQRDTERAALAKERYELEHMPDEELAELAELYEAQGLSKDTASRVATELTAHDALRAHAQIELGIDPDHHANPWAAALASMVSFALGSVLPLLAIALPPVSVRIPITFVAVIASLSITGWVAARLGGAAPGRAIIRNVLVSVVTMVVTFAIGSLVGTHIG
ncbi:VIT1/CCC1 transporter family protein [Parafrigoribacterium soli]|uniref:VIT1/CCC1 transporter family protein n=1 Tax=Parafrigoribacterium soli TaxID=3144663 RepID=UPI0032EFA1D9